MLRYLSGLLAGLAVCEAAGLLRLRPEPNGWVFVGEMACALVMAIAAEHRL